MHTVKQQHLCLSHLLATMALVITVINLLVKMALTYFQVISTVDYRKWRFTTLVVLSSMLKQSMLIQTHQLTHINVLSLVLKHLLCLHTLRVIVVHRFVFQWCLQQKHLVSQLSRHRESSHLKRLVC